jgi:hypothetical protein
MLENILYGFWGIWLESNMKMGFRDGKNFLVLLGDILGEMCNGFGYGLCSIFVLEIGSNYIKLIIL